MTAYRESSIPLSYLSARGEPIGHAIDLCHALVNAIGRYQRWFLQKLPSGASLDLPMSPQLDTILQTLAIRAE